jgi:hypothetical protein
MRSLGREIKAASALEKKADRAKQARKATRSQLSASSTYHHPQNPPLNKLTIFLPQTPGVKLTLI